MLAWLVGGCTGYIADGRRYWTSRAAISAFDRHTQDILAAVTPRDAPVAPAAQVVVPTSGMHRAVAGRGGLESGTVYIATLNEHVVDSFVQALRRRRLFGTLDVTARDDADDPPRSTSDDYTVWFAWLHRQQAGWWIRKGTAKRWVSLDMTQTDRRSQMEQSLVRFETTLVDMESLAHERQAHAP